MRKAAYIFFALLYALAPFGAVAIIGLVFYQSFPNIIGISIIAALSIGATIVGRFIFKRVLINGPIDFMSHIHASPELDNLEPVEREHTKRRQPQELVSLINKDDHLFKGGTLCFFGDWFGERYKKYHKIINASFDESKNIIELIFDSDQSLEIENPQHIFEASTFLKILKVDSLKFKFTHDTFTPSDFDHFFLFYKKEEQRIATYSNATWLKKSFDVSLGEPVLIIFSR